MRKNFFAKRWEGLAGLRILRQIAYLVPVRDPWVRAVKVHIVAAPKPRRVCLKLLATITGAVVVLLAVSEGGAASGRDSGNMSLVAKGTDARGYPVNSALC